ncbi:MAG: MucB/RseB C-terminal domain-containing protein [Rubrivivax sp.]|nr:MucB/RseB C-terminal domain-containing protein [Rubrivivax sp.]
MRAALSIGRPLRCASLLLAALAGLHAQAAPPRAASAVEKGDPAAWVERIHQAAQQRSYAGTLVFTAADIVSSSRVLRLGVGDQIYERIEALDGRQQRSFRHNDQVHTIWPASRVVTVERRSAVDETVGLPQLDPRLQTHYEIRLLGREKIAGREAVVLLLQPRDELRFAQRLWADRETGLLLRADVLSAQGQVLESSAFSNVEVDVRPTREQTLNPARRLEGFRTVTLNAEATSLDAEGWSAERLPAGFRLLGCVQRVMGDPVAESAARLPRAMQAVFSDGLARVSVFVEAAEPNRSRQPLMTHLGATHTLMKPRDNRWWITVMGDVPLPTLRAFSDALVRSKP